MGKAMRGGRTRNSVPHCDHAGDVQALVLGGTKEGGKCAPSRRINVHMSGSGNSCACAVPR